jgi:malonyl-CoA/methylmalonyl-CoA synthetase
MTCLVLPKARWWVFRIRILEKSGVAVVIAKPGATVSGEVVIAALKSQLANFKIPKKCFVVDALPRNTMGKVQKNLLRDQYKLLF